MCEDVNNDFVSYIASCLESFMSGVIDTDTMVKNVSEAILLQCTLMEQSKKCREESARRINSSPKKYSAIQKLTSLICIIFFKGS